MNTTATLPAPAEVMTGTEELRTEQVDFGIWLSLPEELREPKTQRELAIKFGVHEQTVYAWKSIKAIQELRFRLVQHRIMEHEVDVWHSLMRLVKDGNLEAIRLYFQATGRGEGQASAAQGAAQITIINALPAGEELPRGKVTVFDD